MLACEANVNEDELLNLIDSGPVDAVLYGKTVQPSRSEGIMRKEIGWRERPPTETKKWLVPWIKLDASGVNKLELHN